MVHDEITLSHEGKTYAAFTAQELLNAGVSQVEIDAALSLRLAQQERDGVRQKITAKAGDDLSLLGTTSDVASIAILIGAAFMASLDEGTSFAAFRAKATTYMNAISGDMDPTEVAQAFLASLEAGEFRVPALEKGLVDVLVEVKGRGTAVAEAISPSSGGEA